MLTGHWTVVGWVMYHNNYVNKQGHHQYIPFISAYYHFFLLLLLYRHTHGIFLPPIGELSSSLKSLKMMS